MVQTSTEFSETLRFHIVQVKMHHYYFSRQSRFLGSQPGVAHLCPCV